MLCGKHLRRMHGDCSQEKPLDDDYVSYELNYHSLDKTKLYSREWQSNHGHSEVGIWQIFLYYFY